MRAGRAVTVVLVLLVGDVGLEPFQHRECGNEFPVERFAACRFQRGFVVFAAQTGQHIAGLEQAFGDSGTVAIQDHRDHLDRGRPKRGRPSDKLIAGQHIVSMIVADGTVRRVGGIPVFKTVQPSVFGDQLAVVEKADYLRG